MNKLSQRDAHIVTSDAFANSIQILSTTRSYIERTMVREEEPRNPDFEHSLRVRYNQLVLDKSDELSTCVKLYMQHELRVAEWLTTNHLIAEGIVREEESGDDFIVGYLEAWSELAPTETTSTELLELADAISEGRGFDRVIERNDNILREGGLV